MMNQTVLVGRIVQDPKITELEDGKKVCNVTVAIPRSYKNENGEYDTDFLDCTLWSSVAESTTEYCNTGDMIGVKGRIQTRIIESPDGIKRKKTEIVAEKVTFLTSSPNHKKTSNDDDSSDDA